MNRTKLALLLALIALTLCVISMYRMARAQDATLAVDGAVSGAIVGTTTPPPLQLFFHPLVPCSTPPGTPVIAIVHTGGDGNPVTLSMPPSGEFELDGYHIVVGPTGLRCDGQTDYLSVIGSQP